MENQEQRYRRSETDDFDFGRNGCQAPDCDACQYRNHLRKLWGTLIEAAQTANDAAERALAMWGECQERACTFERELYGQLATVYQHVGMAISYASDATAMWKTLPPAWAQAERDAFDVERTRAHRLLRIAQQHEIERRHAKENGK